MTELHVAPSIKSWPSTSSSNKILLPPLPLKNSIGTTFLISASERYRDTFIYAFPAHVANFFCSSCTLSKDITTLFKWPIEFVLVEEVGHAIASPRRLVMHVHIHEYGSMFYDQLFTGILFLRAWFLIYVRFYKV